MSHSVSCGDLHRHSEAALQLDTQQRAASREGQLEVRVFEGLQGLELVTNDWKQITESMADRWLVHLVDWHRCILDALEPDPELALFLVVYEGGRPEAIFPFMRSHRRVLGVRIDFLEVTNHPHIPFCDFILAEPARFPTYLPVLLEALTVSTDFRWDSILLPQVLEDSPTATTFGALPGLISRRQPEGHCDYLAMMSHEELLKGLSSRFRNNLRRAKKRADELGSVTYASASESPELEELFEEFLDVEASGWKGKKGIGTAIRLDERLETFYRLLLTVFSSGAGCHIHVVRHGDRPIAAAFSLLTDRTLYGLKIGFDEEYTRIAPGNLLHEFIFRQCAENPAVERFNFTSGARWHSHWRPLRHGVSRFLVYRPTLKGRFACFVDASRAWLSENARRWAKQFFVRERGRLCFRPAACQDHS